MRRDGINFTFLFYSNIYSIFYIHINKQLNFKPMEQQNNYSHLTQEQKREQINRIREGMNQRREQQKRNYNEQILSNEKETTFSHFY